MISSISTQTFQKFTGVEIEKVIPEGVNPRLIDQILIQQPPLFLVYRAPEDFRHEGAMGKTETVVTYFAICENGEVLPSPKPHFTRRSNRAHTELISEGGINLGKAWGGRFNDIQYVVEYRSSLVDWENREFTDETTVILYMLCPTEHQQRIAAIRRRVEDAIRKGTETQVIQVAALLGVNLSTKRRTA